VKKNHFVFPAGRFGAALLLLRTSAAATLAGVAFHQAPLHLAIDAGLAGLAGALLLGVFTRAAAAASAAVLVIVCVQTGGFLGAAAALHGLNAVALSLLGAGAYSLDSRLFGRRVITLPE
jgi:hypothetical protein